MSDLKPCPFCGREPEVAHRGGAFGFKCVCAGTRFVQSYGKTEEAAKLNWNMRFFQVPQSVADALAAKDAEIAKLREALQRIEKAPAWGAPDKWETTPAEVRHIARAALKEAAS